MGNYLKLSTQSGLSLIATVLALLLFSLFIAVAVSLVTTGSNIGLQEEQGVQALFIADGGLHYTLALNKLNINYSTHGTWIDLGAGQFEVDTPAYLDGAIIAGAGTIQVDSTALFPSTGRITIGTDFGITYTGTNATQFTGASGGQAHNDHDSVYPAAKLDNPGIANDSTCGDVTFTVTDDTGAFDISHPFFIDEEYFLCAGKSQSQFQNCHRCYMGSSFAAHPPGRYASQYILTSTGLITNFLSNNVQRVVRISAGPQEN